MLPIFRDTSRDTCPLCLLLGLRRKGRIDVNRARSLAEVLEPDGEEVEEAHGRVVEEVDDGEEADAQPDGQLAAQRRQEGRPLQRRALLDLPATIFALQLLPPPPPPKYW